jgi:nicotinate-nucleotide--dimethylbenzimidazole phosphoribosyltransferase
METFEEVVKNIGELDKAAMEKAQNRLDSLTKPLGSLGRLEDMVIQFAGITGNYMPEVKNKKIIIMCSDNGVVEEGVSSCPKEVTSSVTYNFTKGITAVNVLSKFAGAEDIVVDIGVDDDIKNGKVLNKKIRKGTDNIAKGPAMTKEEAIKAIEVGIYIIKSQKDVGVNVLGTGEMGIGNTTTSSAITSVLTGSKVADITGTGSGLTKSAYLNKVSVIERAIAVNKPDPMDPLEVLYKLGGFDIAGLVGCFLGAAYYRIPIFIDGFISAVAAMVAVRMNSRVSDFILPSHGSAEPGSNIILDEIKKPPLLTLEMRVGEGTGAALAFTLVDAAFAAYRNMGTFGDAEIEQYVPQE